MTAPNLLVRLEGLLVLLASVLAFRHLGGHWPIFALLFLAPDLAMLGYLAGPRAGSAFYNTAHTYLVPGALAAASLLTGHHDLLPWLDIWFAHIGFDRLLGYGLKYATAFRDTHLQRV